MLIIFLPCGSPLYSSNLNFILVNISIIILSKFLQLLIINSTQSFFSWQLVTFLVKERWKPVIIQPILLKAIRNFEWLNVHQETVENWLHTHRDYLNSSSSLTFETLLIIFSIFILDSTKNLFNWTVVRMNLIGSPSNRGA